MWDSSETDSSSSTDTDHPPGEYRYTAEYFLKKKLEIISILFK